MGLLISNKYQKIKQPRLNVLSISFELESKEENSFLTCHQGLTQFQMM